MRLGNDGEARIQGCCRFAWTLREKNIELSVKEDS